MRVTVSNIILCVYLIFVTFAFYYLNKSHQFEVTTYEIQGSSSANSKASFEPNHGSAVSAVSTESSSDQLSKKQSTLPFESRTVAPVSSTLNSHADLSKSKEKEDNSIVSHSAVNTKSDDLFSLNQTSANTSFPKVATKSRLQQYMEKHPDIAYLLDIKDLVNNLSSPPLSKKRNVTENADLLTFFRINKENIYYDCSLKETNFAFCQKHYLLAWDSTTAMYYRYDEQTPLPASASFDFTYVAHTSIDRLSYIEDLSKIWKGPLSISIFVRPDQLNDLSNWINHHKHIPKLRLAIYIPINPGHNNNYVTIVTYKRISRRYQRLWIYPINYLRDLAIMNVKTTHYLNMDMDMWPSLTTYENFQKIPSDILSNPKSAIILPAFQLTNRELTYLRKNTNLDYAEGKKALRLTKESLSTCVKYGTCTYANPSQNRHNCVSRYWYNMDSPIVTPIPCLNFTHMEPYLLVRRTEETPLYHPFYINYGFNKVIFVENLRYENYKFYLTITDFGFDFPHQISAYTNEFARELGDPGNYKMRMNRKLFNVFADPQKKSFPSCSRRY